MYIVSTSILYYVYMNILLWLRHLTSPNARMFVVPLDAWFYPRWSPPQVWHSKGIVPSHRPRHSMHLWHPDRSNIRWKRRVEVLGKGWKRGSKVVTCYMATFMDNMENDSKVLTIIKRTIWQCIYWKGITCQQNSTIRIYMILCALCILYFSKLLNQDFSPCFIEEYPTDIYTTTTKNDILYSFRR